MGNPNQAAYEEKFKEVQQAYQIIMDQRQGKVQDGQAGAEDFWGFGGFGGYGGQRPGRAKARTINICVLRSAISKTDISEKV